MVVYDGETNADPIIAAFCGKHETLPAIISTGSALFIEVKTYAALPPWTYNGFDARISAKSSSRYYYV